MIFNENVFVDLLISTLVAVAGGLAGTLPLLLFMFKKKIKYKHLTKPTITKYLVFIILVTVYGAAISPMHGYMNFVGLMIFIITVYSVSKKWLNN